MFQYLCILVYSVNKIGRSPFPNKTYTVVVVETHTHTHTQSVTYIAYWIVVEVMEKNKTGKVVVKVFLKRHFE